jgi:hypothetical protein
MGDRVKLSIISGFDPSGFRNAKEAVKELKKRAKDAADAEDEIGKKTSGFEKFGSAAKKGARGVGMLSQAMGDEKGGAATVARAAGGAMMAFASGGWVGLIIAGASTVINHFLQMKAEAKAAAEKMKAAFQQGLIKSFENNLKATRAEYEQINKQIDLAAARMDKLASANDKLNKSGAEVDTAKAADTAKNIEAGYQTKMEFSVKISDEDKATLAAEKKVELMRLANAESISAAQVGVNASERAAELESKRLASARERLRVAQEQQKIAQEAADRIPQGKQWDKAREEARQQVQTAQDDVAKAKTEIEAGAIAVRSAELDLEASTTKLHTARTAAAMKENEVLKAQEDLAKAIDKRTVVAGRILVQEKRLEKAQENKARLDEIAKAKEAQRNAAAAKAPNAFVFERAAARTAKKEDEKDFARAEKKAAAIESREGRGNRGGSKLYDQAVKKFSDREFERTGKRPPVLKDAGGRINKNDRQWLADFKDWKQLKIRGGIKEFDAAKAADKIVRSLEKNLSELQSLNGNLQKNLTEGGK